MPSDTHRDAAVEALATRIRGTQEDFARMRTLVKRITPASVLPAYGGIFLDVSSRIIWVQRSVVGDTATVLAARSTNGSLGDTVYLPHHIQILGVSDNLLLARVSDSTGGAELMEIYRINLRKR